MRTLTRTLALLFFPLSALNAQLVNSEWNTGNGTWNVATSWFPNDVPDNGGGLTYDVQIGNRAVAAGAGVTFVPEDGTSDTISNLTITNSGNPVVSGADLFTNGNQLIVIGQTTLVGSGSTIRVDNHATPGTVAFNTNDLDLNNGGGLTMEGGIASVDVLFEINTGTLGGHGTVNVGDNDLVVEKAFENSSLIQPSSNSSAPQTLTLHSNGVDTIDLDGDSESGLVDVDNVLVNVNGDTITLVIDGPLSDAFGGTLQIGQRDTVTFNDNFTITGANVDFAGGANVATLNGPAAITSIASSAFTVAGATVIENDMTFTGAANTITLAANSTLTLNGTVTIPDASAINTSSTGETIIIGGTTTITEAAGDFDWDSALTTVNGSGFLQLSVDQIDIGNDTYNGALTLNDNGDLSVSVTGAEWQLAGTLNKNGVGTSNITGDRLVVTSTGNIVVNAGTLDTPAITLQAGSDVTTNGTLILGGGADLAGPATLTGTGTLRMEASSTVSASTTVNVSTFDWDGNAVGGTHTINDGVIFTINSAVFDADGDMDDVFTLAGAGSQLFVNGSTQWTANNTITANAAAAGTATIGGTSRMILASTMNVDGNTTISAPLTFATGATASIDSAMILDADGNTVYDGGTITGLGTYDPGLSNNVTASSIISSTNLNLDTGNWTIEDAGMLTIIVNQIDLGDDIFNSTLNLNDNGDLSVSVTGTEWQMAGTLNKDGVGTSNITGDRMIVTSVGNIVVNAGTLDTPAITLQAGSDVIVDGTLILGGGAELAGPTTLAGAGTLRMEASSTVSANTTVNVGTFDWDGNAVGGTHTINSGTVFTINSATFDADGDMDDVFSLAGSGSQLVVNGPTQWTANNTITSNAAAAGTATIGGTSRMILASTLNVDGSTTVSAPITFGSGSTASIDPAMTLSLQGGSNINPNAIAGGTISGNGTLNATTAKVLSGFGTINTPIDFDGTALLEASGGLLDVNSVITDVGTISIAAAPAVLDVAIAFNTSVTDNGINMAGGTLQGASITTATASVTQDISGYGTVSNNTINNGLLRADGGTLIFTNSTNDWDGGTNAGALMAQNNGILEVQDNALLNFFGSATANHGTVFFNGFSSAFAAGSSISLTSGLLTSTQSVNLFSNLTVAPGDSSIQVATNTFLTFEPTSVNTLNGNLDLLNNNITIKAGATFSGAGALHIPQNSHIILEPTANANVLVENRGSYRISGIDVVGRNDVKDFQQFETGTLFFELTGAALGQFDRLVVNGAAVVDGILRTDLDLGFVPALGQTFNVISASAGVSGTFDQVPHPADMANNLMMKVVYTPTLVQLVVVSDTYTPWITSFPGLGPPGANHAKAADPDFDGLTNFAEFAIDGDPSTGKSSGKLVSKIAPVGGVDSFTYTIPVRSSTGLMAGDPLGGPLALEQTTDGVTYAIQASDDLVNWTLDVTEVIGADATAIQSGLPALTVGWVYRTFRSPGPVAGDPTEFMRVVLGGDYVNGSGF